MKINLFDCWVRLPNLDSIVPLPIIWYGKGRKGMLQNHKEEKLKLFLGGLCLRNETLMNDIFPI